MILLKFWSYLFFSTSRQRCRIVVSSSVCCQCLTWYFTMNRYCTECTCFHSQMSTKRFIYRVSQNGSRVGTISKSNRFIFMEQRADTSSWIMFLMWFVNIRFNPYLLAFIYLLTNYSLKFQSFVQNMTNSIIECHIPNACQPSGRLVFWHSPVLKFDTMYFYSIGHATIPTVQCRQYVYCWRLARNL